VPIRNAHSNKTSGGQVTLYKARNHDGDKSSSIDLENVLRTLFCTRGR